MKIFITFADSRLSRSLKRIEAQARQMEFFDEIICLDERALPESLLKQYPKLFVPGVRGFGYWCWKSYIILKQLEKMPEGSQLYYLDAGCHLNKKGLKRMYEYSEMLKTSPTGIIATQIDYKEKAYTKADVFTRLGVMDRPDITDSNQFQATIIFLRKCETSVKFLHEWISLWQSDIHLVDDSPSRTPNAAEFIDHRHDQSCFSVLGKLYGITSISAEEVEPPVSEPRNVENWTKMKHQPILAMRDRPLSGKLFRKILKYRLYASLHLGSYSQKYQDKLTKLYQTTPCLMDPLPYLQD